MTGFIPVSGATNVTSGQSEFSIIAEFSQPLDPASVTISSFILRLSGSSTNISGQVFRDSINTTWAIFTPSSGVFRTQTPSTGASYIPIILGSGNAVGLRNLEGFFARTVSGSFVTAGILQPVDTTPPVVSGTTPANGATQFAMSGRPIVVFSETMLSGTLSGQIKIRVSGAGSDVPATLSVPVDRRNITIIPNAFLSGVTVYNGFVNTGVTDFAGNALAASYTWSFSTFDPPAPLVSGVLPLNGATGVDVAAEVPIAVFTTVLDSGTVSGQIKMRVSGDSTFVPAVVTVSSNGNVIRLTPFADRSHCKLYEVFINTAVKEQFSIKPIAATYSWSFTTYCPPAPTVSGTTPANGDIGIGVDIPYVVVFSTPIQSGSVSGQIRVRVSGDSTFVPAVITVSSNMTTVRLTPFADRSHCKIYQGFVNNTVKEQLGVSTLAATYSWSYSTVCPGTPSVTSTSPVSGATNVSITTRPRVTFNTQLASSSVTTNSFHIRVSGQSTDLPATVTLSSNLLSVEIATNSPLPYFILLRGFVDTTVTDVLGINPMAASFTWSFTTAEPTYNAIYNVTNAGSVDNLSPPTTRAGLKVFGSGALVGHTIKRATVYLNKAGSPGGTIFVRIRGSGDGIATTLGSVPIASVLGGVLPFTFTNLSSNYTFTADDKFVVEYYSGIFASYAGVGYNTSDTVAGVQRTVYSSGYSTPVGDMSAILYEIA